MRRWMRPMGSSSLEELRVNTGTPSETTRTPMMRRCSHYSGISVSISIWERKQRLYKHVSKNG